MTSPTQSNPLDLDAIARIVARLEATDDLCNRLRALQITRGVHDAEFYEAGPFRTVALDSLAGLLLGAFRSAVNAQVSVTDPCADPPAPARVEALVVSPALRTWEVYGEGATVVDALVAACVAVLEREE
jgi:hypothetical protein